MTALQILFSLIYVTDVSVFFSDSGDEPADPNIIYEEPDDDPQIKMSEISRSIVIRSGEMLSISQKQTPPPMLPRSAYRGIERKGPWPELVGLGYRAVSAVGGDRERARTVHRRI